MTSESPTPETSGETAGSPDSASAVSLRPSFSVPVGVSLLGALSIPLQEIWSGARWLALLLVLLGGFLLLQARLLRLEFDADSLVVYRGDQEIRRFPYADWQGWRVFWPALPVLFYFREVRSIHLLPVLFDPVTLRQQLTQRLDHLAPPPAP